MSGERDNDRPTKDRLIRDQVDSGIPRAKAEEKAIKAMLERDRRLEKSGKR